MAKNQLNEFFREKKAKVAPADIDWAAKRDSWICAVEKLYDTIEKDYLALAKNNLKIDRSRQKTVTEQYIGDYSIGELAIAAGDEIVLFSPKGVNLAGAASRVDVRGDRGEAMIVRQPEDGWALVVSRTPTLRLAPLTDEMFLELLRSVMR